MSDLELRRLDRRAQQGDQEAAAQLLRLRVRSGELPENHILYAAHLGDPTARLIHPTPSVVIDCPNCRLRRDERNRRTRERGPTPLRETPRQCLKCRGAERTILDRGLIKFVQTVTDVPHRMLAAWATDCAEHRVDVLAPRNALAFQGRYRLPNQPTHDPDLVENIIPAIRHWLATGEHSSLLYQRAAINVSPYRSTGVPAALATIVALADVEDQDHLVRFRAAEVASAAYHAAGGTRSERSWQEERLISYLLGYRSLPLVKEGQGER